MTRSHSCNGRRKSADATRTAILEAAREKFAHSGYDRTGLREIAAAAGVDAALICRYFGSKQELLAAVLAGQSKFSATLAGPPERMGAQMAEQLLLCQDKAQAVTQLLITLHAASSAEANALLRQSIETKFLAPLRARLTGKDRAERALLIVSSLFGAAVMRFVLCEGTPVRDKPLAALLGALLQSAVAPGEKTGA